MTSVIDFIHVNKSFSKKGQTSQVVHALNDVHFSVEEGDFFALLGPNGAGKTTLINILSGLQRASSGTVKVLGHDVVKDYRQTRAAIGVVPQEIAFDPFFTVRETLTFQSGYFGIRSNANKAWIDELLEALFLTDKANSNMRQLSGGMKRRVMVAQALVHKPPVIVLDEPTAGVDVELRHHLWTFIRRLNQEGHTILLTTHYLEEAEALSRHLAFIKKGRIVALSDKESLMASYAARILKLKIAVMGSTPNHLQEIKTMLSALLAPYSFDIKEGWLIIHVREGSHLVDIMKKITQSSLVVEDMQVEPIDLEDVFLEIVGMGTTPSSSASSSASSAPSPLAASSTVPA